MESTGVYWRPVYHILEASFEVLLVNAQHVKAVPGRKTDVKDCQWLAQLLEHGLLRGSFVPPAPLRELRELTRYRRQLVQEHAREANRVQKVLETANIKLGDVATDVLGVSGRAMLHALIAGERDPERLADLARGALRQKAGAARGPSLSGLVIVLTLPVNEEEGHRPYLSQSAYPAKGTTVGGRTDDPRRERTRDALARHRARAGAGQRQRGVPRAGDLADRLLSLAQPAGTLRGRRRAPAPAARPGGAPGGDGARSGAAGARDRDQRGHLGLPTDRGLPRPDLAGALGAQHGAAAAAPGRAGHPARATDGARAAGGADGGTADGTYSPTPVARPLRPHAARRGERAGRARVSGHVLHRQPQRRRQSLADHGVRCGDFVRAGRPAARPRCGGRSHVPARGGRPPLPARGVADAPRPHRWRARVQGGV